MGKRVLGKPYRRGAKRVEMAARRELRALERRVNTLMRRANRDDERRRQQREVAFVARQLDFSKRLPVVTTAYERWSSAAAAAIAGAQKLSNQLRSIQLEDIHAARDNRLSWWQRHPRTTGVLRWVACAAFALVFALALVITLWSYVRAELA